MEVKLDIIAEAGSTLLLLQNGVSDVLSPSYWEQVIHAGGEKLPDRYLTTVLNIICL